MSYQTAIDQLNSMVPELATAGSSLRRKFSLDEERILLAALGHPERSFRSVLIAGTNGKGSTASTLASILVEAGLKVGLYTSPHLVRVNERMRAGGDEIPDEVFGRLFFQVYEAGVRLVADHSLPQLPSFFEVLTALAFCWFAELGVEIAVLEVGMGGRLDATNVVDPELSILTDISLDHMEWLGSTVDVIAREKAGILREGRGVVRLPQGPDVDRALDEERLARGASAVDASRFLPAVIEEGGYVLDILGERVLVNSPLLGEHQHRNVALAVAAASELAGQAFQGRISARDIQEGVRKTRWPGRMERLHSMKLDWLLDVAHNPAGARALVSGLRSIMRYEKQAILIFSCLRDKPLGELAEILFPLFAKVILTPIQSSRAASLADLEAVGRSLGVDCSVARSSRQAINLAVEFGSSPIVVSGSVYLVGEVRRLLLEGVD